MNLDDDPIAATARLSSQRRPRSIGRQPLRLALPRPRLMLAIGIGVALLALAFLYIEYLRLGAYVDHIEGPSLVSGWQYLVDGMALYRLEDGMSRFSTFYGPLTYLTLALPPLLLGASITISKLAPIFAACITLAVMAGHLLRRRTMPQALQGFFLLAAGMMMFTPMSFWVRPDAFETLLVALAVVSAPYPFAIGIFIGLAVNFKAHAFVYFLPILAEMGFDRRWRALLIVATTSSVVFLAPFFAPGISLHDYIFGLEHQIGDRHWNFWFLLLIVPAAGLLALPLLWTRAAQQEARDRRYAITALIVLLLLVYPALIPGSGSHHFLPLVPILAEAYSRLRPQETAIRWVVVLFLLAGFQRTMDTFGLMAERRDWSLVADEALSLARQGPTRSVQIGYGNSKRSYEIAELSRTELSLNGNTALIDAQVLIELQEIGVDGSARWLPYLTQCGIKRWLLPRGEAPFAMTNVYYDGGPLFSAEFRRAFLDHYRIVFSSPNFDIWDCAQP